MTQMQKNIACKEETNVLNNENIQSNPENNSNNQINSDKQQSNPFVETFREMNENQMNQGLADLMKLLGNSNECKIPEGEGGDIKNLYDILGKLSDNKECSGDEPDKAKLESLFGDLLEFLLKSDMLAEPLNQIKNSVLNYLEKNQGKLEQEKEEKYKSMLVSIDTILTEIHKKEPNKALVIEIFYKLHELSDLDSDILPQGDNSFKQFTDLFGGSKN